MRFISEGTLKRYRGPGICEWCRKRSSRREPHHVFHRGMSSGNRLDISVNLVSLCATFTGGDNCHARVHNGEIMRIDLLAVVAARENTQQDRIESVVHFLLKLDKHASLDRMADSISKMRPGAGDLARRVLREMGKIPKEEAA